MEMERYSDGDMSKKSRNRRLKVLRELKPDIASTSLTGIDGSEDSNEAA